MSPTVCAVMLANGRQAMVERAVRCFEEQVYPTDRRLLLVYDTGRDCIRMPYAERNDVAQLWAPEMQGQPIGTLRNLANAWAASGTVGTFGKPDILMHWDSDDWSHPERIAEQVEVLIGVHAVGYNELLFWDSSPTQRPPGMGIGAWVYKGAPHYAVGTSLAYWRDTWERKPFPALMTGEDTEWQKGLNIRAISGLLPEPRMIAAIHGGNTTCRVVWNLDRKSGQIKSASEWRRTPRYDEMAERIMRL